MRRAIQPLLSFIRWAICHTESGRRFTQFYQIAREKRRRRKACMRLQRFGWEVLEKAGTALGNEEFGYFVDYGTLLGLVREQGFIQHDDDIDFSLPYGKSNPGHLLTCMLNNGFTFLRSFIWQGQVTEITFLYKKIEVDFFYVFRENDGRYFSLIYDMFLTEGENHVARKITRIDKPGDMSITNMAIHGMNVPIPCATDDFLKYNYGDNWKIPDRNFMSDSQAQVHRRVLNGMATMFVTLKDFTSYLSTSICGADAS